MVFTIKYRAQGFPVNFPIIQFYDLKILKILGIKGHQR